MMSMTSMIGIAVVAIGAFIITVKRDELNYNRLHKIILSSRSDMVYETRHHNKKNDSGYTKKYYKTFNLKSTNIDEANLSKYLKSVVAEGKYPHEFKMLLKDLENVLVEDRGEHGSSLFFTLDSIEYERFSSAINIECTLTRKDYSTVKMIRVGHNEWVPEDE